MTVKRVKDGVLRHKERKKMHNTLSVVIDMYYHLTLKGGVDTLQRLLK